MPAAVVEGSALADAWPRLGHAGIRAGAAVDELRDVPRKMATRKPVGVCVDWVQVDSTTAPYRCCAAWAEVPRRSPMRCQEMPLALADVTASTT